MRLSSSRLLALTQSELELLIEGGKRRDKYNRRQLGQEGSYEWKSKAMEIDKNEGTMCRHDILGLLLECLLHASMTNRQWHSSGLP